MHGYKLKTLISGEVDYNDKKKFIPINKFNRMKENFFVEKCDVYEDSSDESVYFSEFDYNLEYHQYSSKKIARHECIKYCEPFKINYALAKLFVVPFRRESFYPGEKLILHCNEGHISSVINNNENEYVNRFDLECEVNGKWYLKNFKVKSSNGSYLIKNLEIAKSPICFSIDKLIKNPTKKSNTNNVNNNNSNSITNDLFLGEFTYSELNVRTFSMIILFCGLLFSIVILCLTIINYYSKRFAQRNLFFPQNDPLICSEVNVDRILNQEALISRSLPIDTADTMPHVQENQQTQLNALNWSSSVSTQHVDCSHLPSYEEATANVPRGNFNFQFNSNHSQTIVFERAQANTVK